jgi:hypothetical protein
VAAIVILVPLLAIVYFGTVESYIYLTRSEAKERAAAQAQFIRICDDMGLDPNSFHGPDPLSNAAPGLIMFVWTKSPEEEIYVSVTYLPYDLPYSVSRGIARRPTARKPSS